MQQEIIRLLFIKAGVSLNQRGIANLLGVSQPAVMKAIPELEKQELIKTKQDKNSKRGSIELNRDSHYVIGLKRADNLKQLYESGLVQFLENTFPGATIILFGSYADGYDTQDSDIDIANIGYGEKNLDLAKFDKLLERSVSINYYPSLKKIDKGLLNNILNGITLKGAVSL